MLDVENSKTFFRERKFYFYLFSVFVLLRLSLILFVDVVPHSDAGWYYKKAIELSQGLGYKKGSEFTAFWPVGYPALLGGLFYFFSASVLTGQLANLFFGCLSLYLIIKIAHHLTGSESITKLTAIIFTLYPNNIAYSSLLLTETVFTALLLLACWIFIRKEDVLSGVLSGVVFGLATLIKSQTIVFPVALAFLSFLVVKSTRFKFVTLAKILAVYLALGVVLAPWAIRNYSVFDEFVLVSTNGGISMLAGNNPDMVPDYKSDYAMGVGLMKSVGHPYKPELEVSKDAKRMAQQWIKNNPDKFLALVPHKIWRLWAADGEAEWSYQATNAEYAKHKIIYRTTRIINQIYYVLIIVFALMFPVFYIRKSMDNGNPWIWLGYLFAMIITAISIVFSGQSRYHYPVMPFLMINAAWVAIYLKERFAMSIRKPVVGT